MENTTTTPHIFNKATFLVLIVIQLPFLALGWISYALGSIVASLFTWISFLSLLWYPLDWLNKRLWMGCEVLKQKLKGQSVDWAYAGRCWDRHFPVF